MTNLTTAQIIECNTILNNGRNTGEIAEIAANILDGQPNRAMYSADLSDAVCKELGLPEAYLEYQQDGANVHQRGIVGFAILESNGFVKSKGVTSMDQCAADTIANIKKARKLDKEAALKLRKEIKDRNAAEARKTFTGSALEAVRKELGNGVSMVEISKILGIPVKEVRQHIITIKKG